MSYKLKQQRPRCECCDEILEEVFTMRQRFEKLMHQLSAQIVELRREVGSLNEQKIKKLSVKTSTNKSKRMQKFKSEFSIKHPLENELPRKKARPPMKVEGTNIATISDDNTAVASTHSENSNDKFAEHFMDVVPEIRIKSIQTAKREFINFTGLQSGVIPTMPFICPEEFEDWDEQFTSDVDKKDKLRNELLQGHFEEPDMYIKHIWKTIMTDDAANGYSLRGNIRTHKKALRSYNFTEIFKDCFLQRFENLDEDFFLERTTRFFNYAQDRTRRIFRLSAQRKQLQDFENVQFEESMECKTDLEETIEHEHL